MRCALVLCLCLSAGCVSMSEACKLQQRQGELLQRLAEEQQAARPAATPAEAERISLIRNVAMQVSELSRVNLKKVGPSKEAVPDPSDLAAVKDFTERYETAIDEENLLKGVIKNFAAKRFGWGDAPGAGGFGAVVLAALAMWKKKRKSDLIARQTFQACEKLPKDVRQTIALPKEARQAHADLNDEWKARPAV